MLSVWVPFSPGLGAMILLESFRRLLGNVGAPHENQPPPASTRAVSGTPAGTESHCWGETWTPLLAAVGCCCRGAAAVVRGCCKGGPGAQSCCGDACCCDALAAPQEVRVDAPGLRA